MAEAWPDIAYEPAQDSVQVQQAFRAPDATDIEDGNRRYRRSSTLNLATLQMTVAMSNADFITFKAWVRDTLVDGTLAFTMPIWDGAAYTTKTCQFREPYQDNPGSGLGGKVHQVQMTLDVTDY